MVELPDGWSYVPLRDVAAPQGLIGGPFGSSLGSADYVGSGVPVIRGAQLAGPNRFETTGLVYVSAEKARELARNQALPGDLVFTQRGTLGQVGLVPNDDHECYVISQSQMRLRPDPTQADAEFLYFVFRSPRMVDAIKSHAIVTGVPHINLGILGALEVPVPPLHEQRAIAEVLGSLDGKIESNRRLSRVLRDLADALWASFQLNVDAWTSTTFGAFAGVFGGSTPRTTEGAYWGGPHCWVTPSDVTGLESPYLFSTSRTITDEGLRSCSTELHPPGTIFMTSRASIGHFVVGQVPCAANQGFIVVRPERTRDRWFLFHEMNSRLDDVLDRANGSTFLEVSRGSFKAMHLRVPSDPSELDHLHAELDPLHKRSAAAAQENTKLAELRDALLPELLSGRLRVPEAEELVESVT